MASAARAGRRLLARRATPEAAEAERARSLKGEGRGVGSANFFLSSTILF